MKYKRRTLEVSLKDVKIDVCGERMKGGRHLITATLVYPRPAISEKSIVRAVALEGGVADMAMAGWAGAILFKEVVHGSTPV